MRVLDNRRRAEPEALEAALQEELSGVGLITEIGISRERYEELRSAIEELARTQFSANLPGRIRRLYPALYATYLVAEGIHSYDGGEFWPHVVPRLRGNNLNPGHEFQVALRELGLDDFQALVDQERALEHITRILAHGGIPASCLTPFLRLLIQELRPGAVDAEDLLARWRARHTKLEALHAPARRFLLYGGQPAVDLLDRCIDLIEEAARRRETPSADEVGLPEYVIAAFRRLPAAEATVRSTGRASIPRPELMIDPYDRLGPTVVLPALPGTLAAGTWRLGEGGASRSHSGSSIRATSVRVEPSRSFDVEFESPDLSRRWSFEGLERFPCLVFDPDTGRALRDPAIVQLESAWVLADCKLQVTGDGQPLRLVEELPAPRGAWTGFRLDHVDLHGVHSVELMNPMTSDRAKRLSVVSPRARAQLRGIAVDGVTGAGGRCVYADMPSLSLPAGVDPDRWRIQLRSASGDVELDASESKDGAVALVADGEGEGGRYDLRVRGPLGTDMHTSFVIAPGLVVRMPRRVLLPSDGEPKLIARGLGLSIDGRPLGEPVALHVPDDVDRVQFEVADGTTRLELVAQVPKLSWAVTHEREPAQHQGQGVLTIGAEEFEDDLADVLTIRTGRPGTEVGLELHGARGLLQAYPVVKAAGSDGRWSFDLGSFSDTVRATHEPRLRLLLRVNGDLVEAAKIVPRLGVRALRATSSQVAGEFASVHLEFEQDRLIRDRVMRLWSRSRPWDAPLVRTLEDEQNDVEFAGFDLPPGVYRAEVAIEDAWVAPQRPRNGTPNTALIRVGERADEIAWLERLDPTDPKQLLQQLAAGVDSPEEQRSLRAAPRETVLAALAALEDIAPGKPASPMFARLREAACRDPATIFAGIADVAASDEARAAELRRLSVRLLRRLQGAHGVTASALEAVWRVAPILAAVVDVPAAASDADAAARCQRFLAWAPGEEVDTAGGRVSMNEAGRTADELVTLRRYLALQPQRLFDSEALLLANFEWLILQKRADEDGSTLVEPPADWRQRNSALVSGLSELECARHAAVERQLDARIPPRGTFPWADIPQVVLAAAIHATADSPIGTNARRELELALSFAPTLVEHDIALALTLTRVSGC